eukprot:TRINITY_DN3497_c0_g1_i1.p2 TRINITY_DN3497_c0_g1~~TRINITY_DN3497_c0_g1_i1.p2  ORF type:complete len:276 (-),score=58.89 TRINITY_DN3497_c0_g1_i1:135-962(-)
MGYRATMVADNTSRWAEALIEVHSLLQEAPGDRGYPSCLASRLAAFYARAGMVRCIGSPARSGAVSVLSTVSPPGGDFSDPLVEATLQLVQTFWGLDKKLAQRKHFPSINWLLSYCKNHKVLDDFYDTRVDPEFVSLRRQAFDLFEAEDKLADKVTTIGVSALPDADQITLQVTRILRDDFLIQNQFTPYDHCCPLYKTVWMLRNIMTFHTCAMASVTPHRAGSRKWAQTKNKLTDLMYKLTCMKFQDPSDGERTLVAYYRNLNAEIKSAFDDLP